MNIEYCWVFKKTIMFSSPVIGRLAKIKYYFFNLFREGRILIRVGVDSKPK